MISLALFVLMFSLGFLLLLPGDWVSTYCLSTFEKHLQALGVTRWMRIPNKNLS